MNATHTFVTLEGNKRFARNVEFTERGVSCEFSENPDGPWLAGLWAEDILGGNKTFIGIPPETFHAVAIAIASHGTYAMGQPEKIDESYDGGIGIWADYIKLSADDYSDNRTVLDGLFLVDDYTIIPVDQEFAIDR